MTIGYSAVSYYYDLQHNDGHRCGANLFNFSNGDTKWSYGPVEVRNGCKRVRECGQRLPGQLVLLSETIDICSAPSPQQIFSDGPNPILGSGIPYPSG